MATFPHNLCGIRQDGHAEQHAPVVLRSEVERGMPRQRRTSADARVTVPCTLVFRSAAAAAEFEAWYYAEGFGWFDFTLPRTGAVVQARIVGGDIGGLTPITPAWNASERSITLEYIRPGFIQLPPGLHSVNPARILSVQRNSTATYVDDAGLLQTAAANVARYEGGLMLVEGEATNFVASPDLAAGAAWLISGPATVTDVLPTGMAGSCSEYVASADQGNIRLGYEFGGVSSTGYAGSVWARSTAGTCAVYVEVNDQNQQYFVLNGSWQRISTTALAGGAGYRFMDISFLGGQAGAVIRLFGANVTEGLLSSYIPYAGTPAADLITVAA